MKTEQYAYLEVEELDTFSYTINENSKEEETYYIAMSLGYPYVVKLDSKTLKQIEENAYTADTETIETKPVTIYGMTESVAATAYTFDGKNRMPYYPQRITL